MARKTKIILPLLVCFGPTLAFTQDDSGSEKKFEVYGFLQSDYVQDFKRVNPNWDDTLRPSRIPTNEGEFGSDGQAIISPRQSRFGVMGNLPVQKHDLFTKFEIDMFGVGVDEGQTTLRLRHAYGQWGPWLGGQTNSLYMDDDGFPNVIDYWGPNGLVFLRTPQLRYTFFDGAQTFAMALEKPLGDIDPGQFREVSPEFAENVRSDEKFPDVTARYKSKGDWGHFQVSGILRSIGFETLNTEDNEPKDTLTGWGSAVSGTYKFTNNNIFTYSVNYGEGIASYQNDGGNDLSAGGTLADPHGELVPLLGYSAYLTHEWSEQYTSSIGYARVQVDNTDLQADDAFKSADYASANLLYEPAENVLFGGELLWGSRTDNDNSYGQDIRTQFSFRYSFSSTEF